MFLLLAASCSRDASPPPARAPAKPAVPPATVSQPRPPVTAVPTGSVAQGAAPAAAVPGDDPAVARDAFAASARLAAARAHVRAVNPAAKAAAGRVTAKNVELQSYIDAQPAVAERLAAQNELLVKMDALLAGPRSAATDAELAGLQSRFDALAVELTEHRKGVVDGDPRVRGFMDELAALRAAFNRTIDETPEVQALLGERAKMDEQIREQQKSLPPLQNAAH